MQKHINVIGGGLAGCEAAYQIAKQKIPVKLYEMKPKKFTPAHSNENLAEVVCSNSFKSNNITNACGLLKQELRILDSLLIKIADETAVPAGQALAVDREKFAARVTEKIEKNPYIEIINAEVGDVGAGFHTCPKGNNNEINRDIPCQTSYIPFGENFTDNITIIATGPLTSDALANEIKELTGNQNLSFFDAAAPIIEKNSIDFNIAFYRR